MLLVGVGRCRQAVSRMLRTAYGCDSHHHPHRSHRTRQCSTFVAEEEISLCRSDQLEDKVNERTMGVPRREASLPSLLQSPYVSVFNVR